MKEENGKCSGCKPSPKELELLESGEYTPEELWGSREPTCPDCFRSGHEGLIPKSSEFPTQGVEMPNPSEQDLCSPIFESIWQVVKSWDVGIPARYQGYCGANGSHVMLILEGIKAAGINVDTLQAEIVRLRKNPVAMCVDGMAKSFASHLSGECKGVFEKGLIDKIETLEAQNAGLSKELESHKRMLLAAACDIGAIGQALGSDMDDDGSAIEALAQEMAKDAKRLDFLESLARSSYTGASIVKGEAKKSLEVMWFHKRAGAMPSLREAIDAAKEYGQ